MRESAAEVTALSQALANSQCASTITRGIRPRFARRLTGVVWHEPARFIRLSAKYRYGAVAQALHHWVDTPSMENMPRWVRIIERIMAGCLAQLSGEQPRISAIRSRIDPVFDPFCLSFALAKICAAIAAP